MDMDQPEQNKIPVGVIGLGSMGMGVARSLLRAGFPVTAYDVQKDSLQRFSACGGNIAHSTAEVGARSQALVIVVVNSAQTDEVLFGNAGAVASMKSGSVVITCATMPPTFVKELGPRLQACGLLHIDAPISGGPTKAREGQLSVMASGPSAAFEICDDLFAAISSKLFRVGDEPGQGSTVKMVNQLLAGIHIAAAAEAIAFGIKQGADPAMLYEVISNSAGSSWMFQNRVPQILAGDYAPFAAVDIFVKDMGIILESAGKAFFPLPLTAAAHQMYLTAASLGLGNQADSSVIKVFPGVDLPKPGKAGD
jgi:putative dehydrogenase